MVKGDLICSLLPVIEASLKNYQGGQGNQLDNISNNNSNNNEDDNNNNINIIL